MAVHDMFSKKYLQKYGWKEGQGLGKTENGIVHAIKPKLKFDKTGIGYVPSLEFTNNWWEKMYNDALEGIVVTPEKDKFNLETKEVLVKEISRSKNKNQHQHHDYDFLFKKCGGRTAHKGARHGLQLNGKLQRLEQQEKTILKGITDKLDKQEEKTMKDKVNLFGFVVEEDNSYQTLNNKRKKKRKSSSDCEIDNLIETPFPDNSVKIVCKKKKKKNKKCIE